MKVHPDFREPGFLREHALGILTRLDASPAKGLDPARAAALNAQAVTRFGAHALAPAWHAAAARGLADLRRAGAYDLAAGGSDDDASLQACEALLAAHVAGGADSCLAQAEAIADAWVQRLPPLGKPLRHHDADPHAADDAAAGVRTGHLARWSRLLLALERSRPDLPDENWLQHRARQLFSAAVERGWDRAHGGGLVYCVAGNGATLDGNKHGAVQAEAIGAAAALAERTSEGGYWDWYDRLWGWSWDHLVDAEGIWHASLPADPKADAPAWHVLGACFEALDALERVPVVRA